MSPNDHLSWWESSYLKWCGHTQGLHPGALTIFRRPAVRRTGQPAQDARRTRLLWLETKSKSKFLSAALVSHRTAESGHRVGRPVVDFSGGRGLPRCGVAVDTKSQGLPGFAGSRTLGLIGWIIFGWRFQHHLQNIFDRTNMKWTP